MKHGVLEQLGGKKHLMQMICARSFLFNCIFKGNNIELGFSFEGNSEMNFVCFNYLENGYSEDRHYNLYFYKISWFKIKHVKTVESLPLGHIKEKLKIALNMDL